MYGTSIRYSTVLPHGGVTWERMDGGFIMSNPKKESTAYLGSPTPALDMIFELLANRRRRLVLYYLYESTDGVATIDELIEFVHSKEEQTAPGGVSRAEVGTTLQHTHLPKIAAAGIVERDVRSETVKYWGQPTLEELLEHAYHKEG